MEKTTAVSTVAQRSRFALRNAVTGVVGVGFTLMASASHAADTYGIGDLITVAKENVTLAVSGVIGVAALGFGVGLLVGFLRK